MQFRLIAFLLLLFYIFSGVILESFQSNDSVSFKDIQEQIIIDENELNVFEKKPLDDINVTEKRVKAWIVIIKYNKTNEKIIKSTLEKSGYETGNNTTNMFFSLGPFSDVSHAKNEVKKLKKIHSIDSKVVDFVF